MRFTGKTYDYRNPTARDLAHMLKLDVEKKTFRTMAALEKYIVDQFVPEGWPPATRCQIVGDEVHVMLYTIVVLSFDEVKPRKHS